MKNKYTTNDVAGMTAVTPSMVTDWIRNGNLEAEKIERPVSEGGDQYLIKHEDLVQFLKDKWKYYKDKAHTYDLRATTIEGSLNLINKV